MKVPNRWTVYILRCSDGSYYTGITTDLLARVARHNDGNGAKYTRPRRPVVPVYWENIYGHAAALRRELAIKRLSRKEKEAFVGRSGVVDS